MKNTRIITYFFLSLLIGIACQEEFADRDFPSVITAGTIIQGSEGVEFKGEIIGRKSVEITELGFIWQINEDPINNPGFRVNLPTNIQTGKFNILIASSIKMNSEYFVRAYAKGGGRIIYGEVCKFTSALNFEPGIISVLPLTGQVGDTVTIKGGIFNSDPARNIVRFNELEAEITTVSDSVIRCVVPFNLVSKESAVSITTDSTTKIFAEDFQLLTPSIISVSPMEVDFLDTIAVSGTGFHKNILYNKVKFGDTDATVLTSSATRLDVRVPFISDSLSFVSVTVSGQTAVSHEKVKVITPSFDSFLPAEAGFLDTLTIYCKNLEIALIKSVLFDNIHGRIISTGANTISVEIPTGLKKEYSSVRVDFAPGEYIFPNKFRLKQPVITYLSSETILNQQVLTIVGSNFNPVKSGNQVDLTETLFGRNFSFIPIFSSPDSLQIKIVNPNKPGASIPSGRYNISVKTCEEKELWTNTILVADTWRRLDNFPGGERYKGVGFAINGRGFAGMGTKISNNLQNDLWEFSPVTEMWTRKSDFPGAVRILPFIFANTSYGFVGGGQSLDNAANQIPYTDFFKYNPVLNSWTKLSDSPFVEKSYPGGYASTNSNRHVANLSQGYISRYNEETNEWSHISSTGTVYYHTATFSINNKVYFVGGINNVLNNGTTNMVWEFDTETNTMTRKNDFPGLSRYGAFAFSINNIGFVGCGVNAVYNPYSASYLNTVYKYHPATDTWEQIESFPGNNKLGSSVFVIGQRAYIIGGYNQSSLNNEVWEFFPGELF
jgi:N-acetylneuraminic acid mutarotase